jgi:ATP-dependent DNA helicase RecG
LLPALEGVADLLDSHIASGPEHIGRVRGLDRAVAVRLDPIAEKLASASTRQFLRRLRRSLRDLDELEPQDRILRLRRTSDAVHARIRRGDRPDKEEVCAPRRAKDSPARDRSSGAAVPVSSLRGVGPVRSDGLASLGIHSVADLLHHLPRAYQDRTTATAIAELKPGDEAVIFGTITGVRAGRGRRMKFIEISVADGSGETLLATWFRPGAWLYKQLQKDEEILLMGKVEAKGPPLRMSHPEIEVGDTSGGAGLHHGVVVPMYTVPQGTGQRAMRKMLRTALDEFAHGLPDRVPGDLRADLGLPARAEALELIHFPAGVDDMAALRLGEHRAHEALLWEDLFILQTALFRRRLALAGEGCAACLGSDRGDLQRRLVAALPFGLTAAQSRVLKTIDDDLGRIEPMQRLLQGDVGSGKTVTALLAAAPLVQAGHQVAVLAPTEVLAWQWYDRARQLYEPQGYTVALLTGGQRAAARRHNRGLTASGEAGLIVGTHAVFQDGVDFSNLGLAVVDEQHRFGVFQRAKLLDKGPQPHLLAMTATPIPRSLALTLFGDLDISVLDERPPRGEVTTELLEPCDPAKAWQAVSDAVARGERAYIICSRVEGQGDGRAVVETAEELAAGPLEGLRLGLLHGRMDSAAKDHALESFRSGQIEVLVGTTVVEVGVDVPEATVMVVCDAHRFGLAQLHQLRGRIGRSELGGRCFLLSDRGEETARLAVLVGSHDGFEIAAEDLRLRGPGDLVGARQSGAPAFRLSTSPRFLSLLEEARSAARDVAARSDFDEAEALAPLRRAVVERLHDSVATTVG